MAIKHCTCKNDYQDERYGKYQRVFNEMKDGKHRCTICGSEK
jgi:hypothetical protein